MSGVDFIFFFFVWFGFLFGLVLESHFGRRGEYLDENIWTA